MKYLLLVTFLVAMFTVPACGWGDNTAHTLSPNDIARAESKESIALNTANIKSIKEDIKIEEGCLELYKQELAKAEAASDDLYAREVKIYISNSEHYLRRLNNWLESNKEVLRYSKLNTTYYDNSDALAELIIADEKGQNRAIKELKSIDDTLEDIEDTLLDLDLANIKLYEEDSKLCQSQLVQYREMYEQAKSSGNIFLTNWFEIEIEWVEDDLVVVELYLNIWRADLTERNNANRIAKELREYSDHMYEPMGEAEWDAYNRKYEFKAAAQDVHYKRIYAGYYEHSTVSTAVENRSLKTLDTIASLLKTELTRLMTVDTTNNAESIRRVKFRINDNNTRITHWNKYKNETEADLKRTAKKLSKSEIKKIKAKYKDLFNS